MAIIITLIIINLYLFICVYESLCGSPDMEPKWNIFHRIANWLDKTNK